MKQGFEFSDGRRLVTATRIRAASLPRRPNARPAKGNELEGFEEEKALIAKAFATICTAGGLRLTAPVDIYAKRELLPILDRKTRRNYPQYQKALFMTTYAAASMRYDPGNVPTEALAWAFHESRLKIGYWEFVGIERALDFFDCDISYVQPYVQNPNTVSIRLLYQTLEEPHVPQTLMDSAQRFADSGQYQEVLEKTLPWVASRAEGDVYKVLKSGGELTPYLQARLAAGGGSMENVIGSLQEDAVRLRQTIEKLEKR